MTRPSKIDEYKLAEYLKTGVTDQQAVTYFGSVCSRQSITLKRKKFEKLPESDPRHLPPRAGLVLTPKGRRRKARATLIREAPKPTDRDFIRLAVREEMKAFFLAVANIDEIIRERDIYKERARIAQRTFSKIEQSQKEYELLVKQGQIQAPLTNKDNPDDSGRTIYVPSIEFELNKLPLLNIKEREFLFSLEDDGRLC